MESYTSHLHEHGFRMTPQRMAILNILSQAGAHLTPIEICQKAAEALPGLTDATVYRTLSFLAQQGLVLAAHVGNGQLVYEIAGRNHHHLICRSVRRHAVRSTTTCSSRSTSSSRPAPVTRSTAST